jgi:hypothetical protein
MLFYSRSRRRALEAPLMYGMFGLAALVGGLASVAQEVTLGTIALAVFGVGAALLLASMFRSFAVRGDLLVVRTVYGAKVLQVASTAFGTRTRRRRGPSEHTVYAFDGTLQIDLADAWSRRGSPLRHGRRRSLSARAPCGSGWPR